MIKTTNHKKKLQTGITGLLGKLCSNNHFGNLKENSFFLFEEGYFLAIDQHCRSISVAKGDYIALLLFMLSKMATSGSRH